MSEQSVSSIHAIGEVSNWSTATDLRQAAEDAMWRLFDQLREDRQVLQDRILILERRLREAARGDG